MKEENSVREKIKSNVGNLAVVAAFNLGFAFFEVSIFIDVAILSLLGFGIYKWNSRICSVLALLFGCTVLYFQFPNFTDVGGWRIALALWWVYSGALLTFYTIKYHRPRGSSVVHT